MNDSVSNPKKFIFVSVGFALIFLANYTVFHTLFLTEGNKQIVSWLQSESVDLQQGNLMTSFSKFDRVLAHGSEIRSIALLRTSSPESFRVLAQIGEPSKFEPLPPAIANSDFFIQQKAPFEFLYYARLPNDPKMILAAKISSTRFAILTIINSLVISLILAFMIVWQSRFRLQQENERSQILIGTIKKIIHSPTSVDLPDARDLKEISSDEVQQILFNLHRQKVEADKAEATNRLAKQVAHDIRSPLSALNMLVGSVGNMSEDQRALLKTVSRRINDIANNLLKTEKPSGAASLASLTLNQIVSEKRIQYSDKRNLQISREFQTSAELNFVTVPQIEISRAISNLINNSIEAGSSLITIRLRKDGKWTVIEIVDDGGGIAPDVIARVGERGFSHDKVGTDSGSGIGVHHAKSMVEQYGGRFSISSDLGHGTTVQLFLVTAPSPSWFAGDLPIKNCSDLFVIDDDLTIHSIWKERLRMSGLSKNLWMYQAANAFLRAHEGSFDSPMYLIDYELSDQKSTGLDLIETLRIGEKSVLVTSHFDDPNIQLRASRLGVRILPKQFINVVEIV